jgi:CRISPR/Cas system CMR subunit Cmr4 (Cas7 group RAMP superfamily)
MTETKSETASHKSQMQTRILYLFTRTPLHVGIDPKQGTAKRGALFNLEAVPAEALFFAPLTPLARPGDDLDKLADLFARKPLLQFGGDGTTGLGFCTVKLARKRQRKKVAQQARLLY